jgi:tripartite-type tricarboxylate transporter receptor subunit TctC
MRRAAVGPPKAGALYWKRSHDKLRPKIIRGEIAMKRSICWKKPAAGMAAACFAAAALPVLAQKHDPAAGFPSRPIRVIVPFSPGGQPDIFARLIGQKVSGSTGQQVVVDNRAGAGGMLGSRIVAEATPDGHTLLSISAAHTILPTVRKLPFDTRGDFAGVSMIYNAAYVLVVPPSLGVKTTKDLIALAKARPGQLNLASAGLGSGTHFAGEVFKSAAAIDVVHVPYKGIPEATNDLLASRVQLFMAPLGSSTPLVREGRMRALGVSSPKRVSVLPDVPTIAEAGLPGFRWDSWGAILAPAQTPRAVIAKLNREITAALRQPDVEKTMRALGAEPAPTTPAALDQFIAQDLAMVKKIADRAGIKPD